MCGFLSGSLRVRARWLLAIEWNPFISSLISDCGVTSVQKCVLVLIHLTFDWIFMMCARRAQLDIKQFAEKAIHSFIFCVCVWSIHPSTDGRTGLVRYIHTDQLFAVNAIRLHIIICVDAMMLVDSKHTWFLILVGCCYLIVCVCFFLCWPIRTLDWIKNNKRKKAPAANAIDCNGNRQITTMA